MWPPTGHPHRGAPTGGVSGRQWLLVERSIPSERVPVKMAVEACQGLLLFPKWRIILILVRTPNLYLMYSEASWGIARHKEELW